MFSIQRKNLRAGLHVQVLGPNMYVRNEVEGGINRKIFLTIHFPRLLDPEGFIEFSLREGFEFYNKCPFYPPYITLPPSFYVIISTSPRPNLSQVPIFLPAFFIILLFFCHEKQQNLRELKW